MQAAENATILLATSTSGSGAGSGVIGGLVAQSSQLAAQQDFSRTSTNAYAAIRTIRAKNGTLRAAFPEEATVLGTAWMEESANDRLPESFAVSLELAPETLGQSSANDNDGMYRFTLNSMRGLRKLAH